MRSIKLVFIISSTIWLTSCATLTQQKSTTEQNTASTAPSLSWGSRVQALSNIRSWDVNGQISIKPQQKSGISANLQWRQQLQNYRIALFGPLGSHAYEINGRPGRVVLAGADGKRAMSGTPEALLAKEVGWYFPVSSLYYWVRGIPVPDLPSQKTLDTSNRLVQLSQQGWVIQYLDYKTVRNLDVPRRIFLNNPHLNVKIVINQWQF